LIKSGTQKTLFTKLNNISQNHKVLGRFCAIPAAAADVSLDVLKLTAIEAIVMAVINLIGAAFSSAFYFIVCTRQCRMDPHPYRK
jgi:hypothetical protein